MTLQDIQAQALQLSADERRLLIDLLWRSLQPNPKLETPIAPNQPTAKTGIIAELIEHPVVVHNFKPLTREEAHDRQL
jgi:hypothetical protein